MAKNKSPEKLVKLKKILNFLGIRARSEKEVRDKLRSYGCKSEETEEIIGKLKKWKLVDDTEFIRQYIDSRSRSRPRSRQLLEIELKRRGIELDSNQETFSINDELMAKLALEKKKNLKSRGQAVRFLQSRGFSWEIIRSVLKLDHVS